MDWVFNPACELFFILFFYIFDLRLLFMNSNSKVWLFSFFSANQCILCTIHLPTNFTFQRFFIKNGFRGTIHIFKNYFATMFFSFQFSTLSKRILSIILLSLATEEMIEGMKRKVERVCEYMLERRGMWRAKYRWDRGNCGKLCIVNWLYNFCVDV